jgi:anti-sigma regulatory factor (Ser/Thr protein kinase)
MVVLRSAHPPSVAELARWTVTDFGELRALRTSVRRVLQTQSGLAGPALEDVAERMTIVASELATNALLHAGSPSVVTMSRARRAFVLDVADDRPSAVPEITERRPAGAGGRGLRLTADLAGDCGWYRDEGTKHVWALFDVPRRRRVLQAPRIAVPGLATLLRRLRRSGL